MAGCKICKTAKLLVSGLDVWDDARPDSEQPCWVVPAKPMDGRGQKEGDTRIAQHPLCQQDWQQEC